MKECINGAERMMKKEGGNDETNNKKIEDRNNGVQ